MESVAGSGIDVAESKVAVTSPVIPAQVPFVPICVQISDANLYPVEVLPLLIFGIRSLLSSRFSSTTSWRLV